MYKPLLQESDGTCPHCGKPMVKHILKEGARYHVISWYGSKNGATSHCSEPDCEKNHGPGHCVPLDGGPVKLPKCDFRGSFQIDRNQRKVTVNRDIVPPKGFTELCCLHSKAPYVIFAGFKDPYLCRVAIREGQCPLHKKIGDL